MGFRASDGGLSENYLEVLRFGLSRWLPDGCLRDKWPYGGGGGTPARKLTTRARKWFKKGTRFRPRGRRHGRGRGRGRRGLVVVAVEKSGATPKIKVILESEVPRFYHFSSAAPHGAFF